MPMQKVRPNVGPEVALEYQNLCISHLMALSGDASEVQDENLLAAAVILRFYEELDGKTLPFLHVFFSLRFLFGFSILMIS